MPSPVLGVGRGDDIAFDVPLVTTTQLPQVLGARRLRYDRPIAAPYVEVVEERLLAAAIDRRRELTRAEEPSLPPNGGRPYSGVGR